MSAATSGSTIVLPLGRSAAGFFAPTLNAAATRRTTAKASETTAVPEAKPSKPLFGIQSHRHGGSTAGTPGGAGGGRGGRGGGAGDRGGGGGGATRRTGGGGPRTSLKASPGADTSCRVCLPRFVMRWP